MDTQVQHKIEICSHARNAEWDDFVASVENVNAVGRAYLNEHPPGLVEALWRHFDATRDRCGCSSTAHERPECPVRLIERLLLDEQSA